MVEKFDLEALKREYVASDERGDAKFAIDFHDMTIVLERLEQAEHGERAAKSELQDVVNEAIRQKKRAIKAEQAVARKQQALDTVVKSLERQLEDVVKATDSQDLIGEDLDGDWDAVWGRLYDLADQKRDAAQAIGRALQLLQTWGKDSDSYHYAVQLGLALSNGDASVAESHLHALDGDQA